MPKAGDLLDTLHETRERLQSESKDLPDDVYLRQLETRAAKVYGELGLETTDTETSHEGKTSPSPRKGYGI